MKESHGKDLASHPDPESCAGGREAVPTATAHRISPVRAATTTPAKPQEAFLVSCPATVAFPVIVTGRLPHCSFRGPAQCSLHVAARTAC